MIELLPHLECYLFSTSTRVVFTLSATYHVVQPERPHLGIFFLKTTPGTNFLRLVSKETDPNMRFAQRKLIEECLEGHIC